MLQIYNSLTQTKEIFKPLIAPNVLMYVCGITVYDLCHIGHARTMVAFDVIVRYLKALNYQVKYVRNITDIDDKIIARALTLKESCSTLTERMIKEMHADFEKLSILPPDVEPRATDTIPQMVRMIQQLMDKGFAYVASNGDVYYDVLRYESYGELAHRDIAELKIGARVEVNEQKKHPCDFVLWKQAKPEEPSWDSPWGKGRPGWHIECSVMSTQCLGESIDIHGGGQDLLFPHHENERAQSEAVTGKPFVNVWMHSSFVQVKDEKMSKSLHNFVTIQEALKTHDAETLRYFLLSTHYRSPLYYNEEGLKQAHASLERLYLTLRDNISNVVGANYHSPENNIFKNRFFEAMNDDFNTPDALSVLFDLAREINTLHAQGQHTSSLTVLLKELGGVLGILQQSPIAFLQPDNAAISTEFIEQQITLRNTARKEKNWQKADEIRKSLLSQGVILEDTAQGTLWRR